MTADLDIAITRKSFLGRICYSIGGQKSKLLLLMALSLQSVSRVILPYHVVHIFKDRRFNEAKLVTVIVMPFHCPVTERELLKQCRIAYNEGLPAAAPAPSAW